ncbi:uncharacterized protein SCHCODRAFT_01038117, partial [Schizophyllum commune H4-8]
MYAPPPPPMNPPSQPPTIVPPHPPVNAPPQLPPNPSRSMSASRQNQQMSPPGSTEQLPTSSSQPMSHIGIPHPTSWNMPSHPGTMMPHTGNAMPYPNNVSQPPRLSPATDPPHYMHQIPGAPSSSS